MNTAANTEAVATVAAEIIAHNAKRPDGAGHVLRLALNGCSRHHSPELNLTVRALAKRHPLVAHLFPVSA